MIVIDYLSLLKKRLKSYKESYSFGTIDILVNYIFIIINQQLILLRKKFLNFNKLRLKKLLILIQLL